MTTKAEREAREAELNAENEVEVSVKDAVHVSLLSPLPGHRLVIPGETEADNLVIDSEGVNVLREDLEFIQSQAASVGLNLNVEDVR
jgi:hypothetical protein